MKLIYAGKFEEMEDGRIWTIVDPTSPYHKSTRTLAGLKELGIVVLTDKKDVNVCA